MNPETILILGLILLCTILLILLMKRRSSGSAGIFGSFGRDGGNEFQGNSALLQMGQSLEQIDRLARQVDEMSKGLPFTPAKRGAGRSSSGGPDPKSNAQRSLCLPVRILGRTAG